MVWVYQRRGNTHIVDIGIWNTMKNARRIKNHTIRGGDRGVYLCTISHFSDRCGRLSTVTSRFGDINHTHNSDIVWPQRITGYDKSVEKT